MYENIVIEGNLKDIPFPLLLNKLFRNGFSGILKIVPEDGKERGFILSSGGIVFAKTDCKEERLGEILLREERITEEQLKKSVEIMKKEGKRQGRILVEMEAITPDEMWAGIILQLKTILFNMFNVKFGKYTLIEGEPNVNETITLREKTPLLILQGIRKINDSSVFKHYINNYGLIFYMQKEIFDSLSLELKPYEYYVLELFDGKRDLHKIIELSDVGEKETLRIVYMGICFEFLKNSIDFKIPTPKKLQIGETEEFEKIIDDFNEVFVFINRYMLKDVGPVGQKVLERSFNDVVEYNSNYFPKARLAEDGSVDKEILLKSLWYIKFEKRKSALLKFLNDVLIAFILDVRKILGEQAERRILKLVKDKKLT